MRRTVAVSVMAFALAASAGAQTKISGKLACAKPDVNSSAEAGDAAGHMVMLTKQTCTWPTPIEVAGVKTKTAVDVGIGDVRGSTGTSRGYNTSTMDNGDKASVSYQGTVKMNKDSSGTFSGTWKWTRGTGKFKGIKGSGTYKGTAGKDGSSTVDIEGDYTLPEPKAAPEKKAEPAKKKPQ
jgi:hypothetical protein